ncbi:MAG: hypothetical protein R2681_02055 [Pyrinomonadaceae bacterium]
MRQAERNRLDVSPQEKVSNVLLKRLKRSKIWKKIKDNIDQDPKLKNQDLLETIPDR